MDSPVRHPDPGHLLPAGRGAGDPAAMPRRREERHALDGAGRRRWRPSACRWRCWRSSTPRTRHCSWSCELPWIRLAGWPIDYHLGVDGLSMLLVLLTTLPDPDRHPVHLDRGRGAGEGVHGLLPAAGDRHAGRVPGPRHVPVLRVLGVHAGADVLPDRHLGRHAAHVRRGQVLPVHHGRLDPDAAGDRLAGARTAARSRSRS